jgi:hypothetical protein|tara:strand:- start:1857 stop:2276 length:420 start_codon:yes stop_codon:yes gene_type:complete
MIEIYSKLDPEKLLHIVYKTSEFRGSRQDLVPDKEFLQLAIMSPPKAKTFKAHKHIFKEVPNTSIAQESWYVVRGAVTAKLYDEDFSHLTDVLLEEGDLSITLYGGHTYEIMEEDTLVLEFKSGPYYGQKSDKEFMDDN